jgi:hypothetical protein
MQPSVRDGAVLSLLQNLELLYPVFPTVALLLKKVLEELSPDVREATFENVRALVQRRSHLVLVPTNLAYALRIIAHDRSEETDILLISLHGEASTDMLLRRDIILALARRRIDYWLSGALKQFSLVTAWERRALIVGSYVLGDEGRHWRQRIKARLEPVDTAFREWVGDKYARGSWDVPL